jgi:hypothetical protein
MILKYFHILPDCSIDWNALTAIGTIFMAIGTFIVLFFQKKIVDWMYRPVLELKFEMKEPYCLQFSNSFYFRLAISNEKGKGSANEVQIQIQSEQNQDYQIIPRNLDWVDNSKQFSLDLLHQGISRFIGLGHIFSPQVITQLSDTDPEKPFFSQEIDSVVDKNGPKKEECYFSLDTIVRPTNKDYILSKNKYEFIITIIAQNFKPIDYLVILHFGGKWSINKKIMLNKSKADFENNHGVWIEIKKI